MDFTQVGSTRIINLIFCRENSDEKIELHFQEAEKLAVAEHSNPRVHGNDPIFPLWWTFGIVQDDEVYLKSITLFSLLHCAQIRLVEINKFSRKLLNWTTENFFPIDILDFYGCELVFGYVTDYADYALLIMNAIKKSLNFSFVLNSVNIETEAFENTELKVIWIFWNEIIDLGSFYNTLASTNLFSDFFSLTIPYGEPFTALEKMFYPFDNHVWALFITAFVIAYLVILLINFLGHTVTENFIYGENVRSPALNVFSIFMGCGMKVLPKKNFARFLLMSFVLFCLIMR